MEKSWGILWEAIGGAEGIALVAVKVPRLERSCREDKASHHAESQGEATGESEAQLQQRTPALCRFQFCGMTTKNSSSSGLEPAWTSKKGL